MRQSIPGDALPRRASPRKVMPQLEEILLHHFPDIASPAMQDGAS